MGMDQDSERLWVTIGADQPSSHLTVDAGPFQWPESRPRTLDQDGGQRLLTPGVKK